MKCRSAAARYFGSWAKEGLCRPCVMDMPSDVRIKVLRDMNPEDRKRWQLDNLNEGPWDPARQRARAVSQPGEKDIQALIDAAESGREADFRSYTPEEAKVPTTAADGTGARRERRAQHRLEVELPLRFRVASPDPGKRTLPRGVFPAVARNLSSRGLKAALHDPSPRQLPQGAFLDLELLLPPPLGLFQCVGRVANLVEAPANREPCFLCVAFDRMAPAQRDVLAHFVESRRSQETSEGA